MRFFIRPMHIRPTSNLIGKGSIQLALHFCVQNSVSSLPHLLPSPGTFAPLLVHTRSCKIWPTAGRERAGADAAIWRRNGQGQWGILKGGKWLVFRAQNHKFLARRAHFPRILRARMRIAWTQRIRLDSARNYSFERWRQYEWQY